MIRFQKYRMNTWLVAHVNSKARFYGTWSLSGNDMNIMLARDEQVMGSYYIYKNITNLTRK